MEVSSEDIVKSESETETETETETNSVSNGEDAESGDSMESLSDEQLEIRRLQQEIEDKQNRYLRLQADFDNYRRRVRLDQESAAKYRAQSLIENILPALDNFERALHLDTVDEGAKQLLKGMEMIYRQITDALKSEGLEVIEAVGQQFDPNFHQAVMQVEDSNFDSNVVTEELQKGYKLKDRVLRPTMVKVNQ
ncbi:nucleotide exchange factor GrpE [Bacillus sp. Marseille-P3661]|uniref:nucleotide exchange factor GrpE n=1 Tax=Bacillus sp. Marseille-P3661 TaxID=1936234 RepID=UPI00115766DC|nr:nucleotide exchange factor GrpE [Bacillus sp. Marseille-P3661]